MTNLARVFVGLTGWDGSPGVNVLHFSQGTNPSWDQDTIQTMCDEVVGIYESLRGSFAPGVVSLIRPEVDIIDVASGEIVDQIAASPAFGGITSTGTGGSVSRATQMLIRFKTDKWVGGRLIRGRMFLGPVTSQMIDAQGRIAAGYLTSVPDAFTACTSGIGTRLAVYRRPNKATGVVGDWGDVVSVSVAPKPGVLRSRRD